MKPILLTAAGNPENQDRGLVIHDGARGVLCVADGAGGRSGGTEAASMTVELVRQNANLLINAESCAEVLRKLDAVIAKDSIAGETTLCARSGNARGNFWRKRGRFWYLADSGKRESFGSNPSAATQTVHWFWQCVAGFIPAFKASRSPPARDGWLAQIHVGRTDQLRMP